VIVHVDLAHFGNKLAADSHYRNQFETGASRGTLSTSSRTQWEQNLFGDAYDGATPKNRCKYGVLNVTNDPQGLRACSQYGSSYLLLRNVRFRTTFSASDSSGLHIDQLATIDHYAHVLERYQDDELRAAIDVGIGRVLGRDSRAIVQYKEAQIHGEVRLADHVELIMADPCVRTTGDGMLKRLSERCNAPVVWIERTDGDHSARELPRLKTRYDDDDELSRTPVAGVETPMALDFEDEELTRAIEASKTAAEAARTAKQLAAAAERSEVDLAVEASHVSKTMTDVEDDELAQALALSASVALEATNARSPAHAHMSEEEAIAAAIAESLASDQTSGADIGVCAACDGTGKLLNDPCPLCQTGDSCSHSIREPEPLRDGCSDDDLAAAIRLSAAAAAEHAKSIAALEEEELEHALRLSMCDPVVEDAASGPANVANAAGATINAVDTAGTNHSAVDASDGMADVADPVVASGAADVAAGAAVKAVASDWAKPTSVDPADTADDMADGADPATDAVGAYPDVANAAGATVDAVEADTVSPSAADAVDASEDMADTAVEMDADDDWITVPLEDHSGPMEEMEYVLKVTMGGDTRRFRARWRNGDSITEKLAAIQAAVREGFATNGNAELTFGDSHASTAIRATLKYADEDGDLCTLVETTLADFLVLSRDMTVRLFVE
jgi:hypothetical protein